LDGNALLYKNYFFAIFSGWQVLKLNKKAAVETAAHYETN